MRAFCLAAFGVLLLASPALADPWKVGEVTGDAVSVVGRGDPDPLDAGSIVKEGSTVVSGPMTQVRLARHGDVVVAGSDTIVDLRRGETQLPAHASRALIVPKAGRIELQTIESDQEPLEVATPFFRVSAQGATFAVDARKDFASVVVTRGEVTVVDIQHGGAVVTLRAGGEFHGSPALAAAAPAKPPETAADAKAPGEAEAEAALKELDKLQKQKLTKEEKRKRSALIQKLAAKGLSAAHDGIEDLADEYEGDAPAEIPRVGILAYLFGAQAPSAGYVAPAIVVVFLLFGSLTASVLRDVSFGVYGNAAILLAGALAGAGFHDYVFTPDAFWAYEPTPGIVTTTIAAMIALVAACFLRRYIEDRLEDDDPSRPKAFTRTARRA